MTLGGLVIMLSSYLQIRYYLQVSVKNTKPYMWMITNPLVFVLGLGLLILPCYV